MVLAQSLSGGCSQDISGGCLEAAWAWSTLFQVGWLTWG